MFNLADIIIIAIIGLAGFLGYKNGFIKTGFGFFSFFVALAITVMFYQPVMDIMKEYTGFETWLTEYLYHLDLTEEKETTKEDSDDLELSETGESYISNLPTTLVDVIGLEEIKTNAKNVIIQKIVNFVEKLVAIVIVYSVARIALAIIIMLLDLVAKIPLLKKFNEVFGFVIGIVLGFVRVYAIFMVVTLLNSFPAANGIIAMINESFIASSLYNNNILIKILF